MAKIVFIFGTGASVRAGVPLMRHFLDRARELLAVVMLGESKSAFEPVYRAFDVNADQDPRKTPVRSRSLVPLARFKELYPAVP